MWTKKRLNENTHTVIKSTNKNLNIPFLGAEIGEKSLQSVVSDFINDNSIYVSEVFDKDESKMVVTICAKSSEGVCPYCGYRSKSVHSRYFRRLRHLPVFGKTLELLFYARKFFCHNEECNRKTFAEQPGTEIFRYQRMTRKAEIALCKTGVLTTSQVASQVLQLQGLNVSRRTVLRHIHKSYVPLPERCTTIGVDDWAYRKGVDYGAVVVDLQSRLPVAILESRKKEHFSDWLREHPEVKLASRDRATEFSSAIHNLDHYVYEVADRFHLLMNIQAVFQTISDSQYTAIADVLNAELNLGKCLEDTKSPRAARFKTVKELQKKGISKIEIHRQTGVSHDAISRYFKMDRLPKVVRSPKYNYEEYRDEVERDIQKGMILKDIYTKLKKRGAHIGSLRTFQEYFSYLSKKRGKTAEGKKLIKPISRREITRVTFLAINKEETMNETQKKIFGILIKQNWFADPYKIVNEFTTIVKTGTPEDLDQWLENNMNSQWEPICKFCKGIHRDIKAVKNALKSRHISQGVVEGTVNKIKALRRAMFGRCSNKLLLLKMVLSKCYFN